MLNQGKSPKYLTASQIQTTMIPTTLLSGSQAGMSNLVKGSVEDNETIDGHDGFVDTTYHIKQTGVVQEAAFCTTTGVFINCDDIKST